MPLVTLWSTSILSTWEKKYSWLLYATETGDKHCPDWPLGSYADFTLSLEGHSQPAHMRITDHFIANLSITETRSILFLTNYDKNIIIGWANAYSETGFSVNDWKSSKTRIILIPRGLTPFGMYFFQVEVNFFQSEKTGVQVSAVPKLISSPYCALSRVCLRLFVLFYVRRHKM